MNNNHFLTEITRNYQNRLFFFAKKEYQQAFKNS